MTIGEKLGLLRKKNGMTQEDLAETLSVSRQSVSRWEMNIAFPETDKLIKLSKLFGCSIDYLLKESNEVDAISKSVISVDTCYNFFKECGYFFLATAVQNQPGIRPFGIIYADADALYFVTDKRKNVYSELINNSEIEMASYNIATRKWIRVKGMAVVESSDLIRTEIISIYPVLKQKYTEEEEIYMVIFKVMIKDISLN